MECKYKSTERPFLYFMVLIILLNTCNPLDRKDLRRELQKTNQKLDSLITLQKFNK